MHWSATWATSCFLLAENLEWDNPSCLVSRDIFPCRWPSGAIAHLCFLFAGKSRQRCINFISAPHRNLFPIGTTCGKSLHRERLSNVQPWKKPTRSQLPEFAKTMGFVGQSWINKSLSLVANNLRSLTFAPSLILSADLQILVQIFLIFSLSCQKDCRDWQRSGELSRQRRASAAGFLAGPDLLLNPLIAQQGKQVENKQLLLEGGLRGYLNYLGKRSP